MEFVVKRTVTELSVDELLALYDTTNDAASSDVLRAEVKRRMVCTRSHFSTNSLQALQSAYNSLGQ